VFLDIPLKVTRTADGTLTLDRPTFGLAGFDQLGVQRVSLTPDAAAGLKSILTALGDDKVGYLEATRKAKN
jgi:hypothetical protein